jgi:hypothetical protein
MLTRRIFIVSSATAPIATRATAASDLRSALRDKAEKDTPGIFTAPKLAI